jgi:hypothetical protein
LFAGATNFAIYDEEVAATLATYDEEIAVEEGEPVGGIAK